MRTVMMLAEVPPFRTTTSDFSHKDQVWNLLSIPRYRVKPDVQGIKSPQFSLRVQSEPQHEYSPSHLISPHPERCSIRTGKRLEDLPIEIQEAVVDALIGNLSPTSSRVADRNQGMRNWSNAMRHPRRRQLSDLALVSKTWRRMVQQRLYRHVKVKGTTAGLAECAEWFLTHLHLQEFVRHIEVWIPVWERRAGYRPYAGFSDTRTFEQHARPHAVLTVVTTNPTNSDATDNINQAYQLASHNATLDEIFSCVRGLFPQACILTIEGGHCKKPPMVHHFRSIKNYLSPLALPTLPNIRTLVLKGAWNIIREEPHFKTISTALPNLREWHCTYAKPKVKAYQTICNVLRNLPSNLTHVNICLEGFYTKETTSSPAKWRLMYPEHHLCRDLGRVLPQLEALTFTGRICTSFFTTAMKITERGRGKPRLRSLDLVVKNCCRDPTAWNDGTGIHNWSFIKAFESLVVAAVQSLQTFLELQFLRIRFIDLDSPCPLLNPYFLLQNNRCTGIWNDEILLLLSQGRPKARFAQLSEDLGCSGSAKEGRPSANDWPRQRPKSIKVSSYAALADLGTEIN